MAMRTRTGQAALNHGKWQLRKPNFDTLSEAGEWGEKKFAHAAHIASGITSAKCYGYTRVSTLDQAENGFSLEAQSDYIDRHFLNRVKPKHPHLEWGETIIDPGVSAFKKRFLARPGGSRLNALLMPGDHVIFPKMDRAFRQGADYFIMSEIWSNRGVIVHYIDPDVDGSTPTGWLMLSQWAIYSEYFSRMLSERTRMGIAKRKELGRTMYHNNQPDVGKCVIWSHSKRCFIDVPANPDYWINREKAADLLYHHGRTEACDLFEDWLNRNNPEYKRPPRSRYEYGPTRLLYLAARHVGINTKDKNLIKIGEVRRLYGEMLQQKSAGIDIAQPDSVSP